MNPNQVSPRLFLLVLFSGLFAVLPAAAQFAGEGPPTARPQAMAVRTDTPPVLDGDVLNDPAWEAAQVITGFWQTTPNEGQPASERTEVRILYTATTLYVGVVAYDRTPSQIIVADSRRDSPLNDQDSFRFIVDTYRDGQNGFIFGTNPTGVEFDAQVSNEGQGQGGGFTGGARAQGGSGGGINVNWDGAWEVRTRTGDFGWSAEFAIPFRTLRFARSDVQTWGINFERTIRRRHEQAFWAPLPRQYSLPRVSLAGTLEGLEIPSPRNLQVMPYLLTSGTRDTAPAAASVTTGPTVDFGGDLKYSITSGMTLDLTYNTDFAQVEVDEQQINLDRFNLFFPEKRPFFLENAGLFSVGQPAEVELFFSRQIGIGPGGEAVPIVGGARMSGDVGGLRIGLLNMQTESVRAFDIPSNNFSVVRLRRELPNRSSLGGIFTNRQGMGNLAADADYNRLAAVDGRLGIGRYGHVGGFAAHSFTPGLTGDQYAFRVESVYDSERWNLLANYTEVSRDFNPEVGFLRRSAYRRLNGMAFHRFRPENLLGFHEIRPHVFYTGFWGLDGLHESGFLHMDSHWEWKNGYEIHTGLNLTREGLRRPFPIFEGVVVPEATYDHAEAMLVGITDRSRPVSLRTQAIIGGFLGGSRVSLTSTLRMRHGEAFSSEVSLNRNDVDLPGGKFTTNLIRARLSYSFTPRIFVQSLLQYNDAAELWSVNFRFGWMQSAATGLFVVFNQVNEFDEVLLPGHRNQTVVIKYTHLFNALN